ncbi:unnamed protein product [Heterobilharzia americana]|nr:unnamed protein product [Heterobilharzia americana]
MALVVFVFYKKRNTVFIYEKSQHGGLYSPGERSMVIGQTKQARKICRRNDSFNSYNNADVEDDDDLSFTNTDENDTEIEFQYHGKASYVVRPEYGIFQNSQCIQKLSTNIQKPPESHCLNEPLETENHVAVAINNANKPFEQPLGPHQHYLSIYSGNISSNPRFLLCPKHAYLISSQNKSNQIIE